MAPPDACPESSRYAPVPRIADWTKKRRNLDNPTTSAPRSAAVRVASSACWLPELHRSVSAGSMPMERTTSALRIAVSACICVTMPAVVADRVRLRVSSSLRRLRPSNSTVAPTASMPSSGCSSQISSRKIGDHGASRNMVSPCEATKVCTWDRSRSDCPPEVSPRSLARTLVASSIGPRRAFSQPPIRTMRLARTVSSSPRHSSAVPTSSVSMTSVSTRPLTSTRS